MTYFSSFRTERFYSPGNAKVARPFARMAILIGRQEDLIMVITEWILVFSFLVLTQPKGAVQGSLYQTVFPGI